MTIKIDDPKAAQGKNVLADFDLSIRSDITEDLTEGQMCRVHTFIKAIDCERCPTPFKEIFGIGWPEELGAGIRGGYLNCAPSFDSVLDAFEWAADNEALIEEECA